MCQPALKRLHLSDIYRNLYPWQNLNQFVELLEGAIAHKSEDNSLIALNKPFGVGVYLAQDPDSSKQNQDKHLSRLHGNPRYCIQDALKPLSDSFNSPRPYQVLKGVDRYMSGLTLISNDLEEHRKMLRRAQETARCNSMPIYGLRAITSGYPIVRGAGLEENNPSGRSISEQVGVQLIEVDELGDHKEPIIVAKPSNKFTSGRQRNLGLFNARLEVTKVNKQLSVALVELFVSKLRWDFARCYLSSKTSFVLGDVRFSKRIREVLGKRMQVSAFRSAHSYDTNYEPLNAKLQQSLGVHKNASVPLMLDLHKLRLPNFYRANRGRRPEGGPDQKQGELNIDSKCMPAHFAFTAARLELLDDQGKPGGIYNSREQWRHQEPHWRQQQQQEQARASGDDQD